MYEVLHGVLDFEGVLSVHPQHVKGPCAADYFIGVTVDDLVREMESASFRLRDRNATRLWNDYQCEDGVLLNFVPVAKGKAL